MSRIKNCLLSKAQIKDWMDALRSGHYPQARDELKSPDGYCCLGVLASRLGTLSEKEDEEHVVPRKNVLGSMGSVGTVEVVCITMNDREKKDFNEIADWIENNLLPDAPIEAAENVLSPGEPED
jgi:hypothetical protein